MFIININSGDSSWGASVILKRLFNNIKSYFTKIELSLTNYWFYVIFY